MQLQSGLVPLHLSTNVSLWTLHDTVPRLQNKCSDQSSDTIRDAIKYKLSTCSLRWENFWYLYKDANDLFKPTRQSERSFTPFVQATD